MVDLPNREEPAHNEAAQDFNDFGSSYVKLQ